MLKVYKVVNEAVREPLPAWRNSGVGVARPPDFAGLALALCPNARALELQAQVHRYLRVGVTATCAKSTISVMREASSIAVSPGPAGSNSRLAGSRLKSVPSALPGRLSTDLLHLTMRSAAT